MHGQLSGIERASNLITAKIRSENLSRVRRRKFFRVNAKPAYPNKTVPSVRALTGAPERTIYDWLKGTTIAPWSVYVALFGEIERG